MAPLGQAWSRGKSQGDGDGCDEVMRCAKHDARWLQPEGLAGTRGGARDAPRSSGALVGPWSRTQGWTRAMQWSRVRRWG